MAILAMAALFACAKASWKLVTVEIVLVSDVWDVLHEARRPKWACTPSALPRLPFWYSRTRGWKCCLNCNQVLRSAMGLSVH